MIHQSEKNKQLPKFDPHWVQSVLESKLNATVHSPQVHFAAANGNNPEAGFFHGVSTDSRSDVKDSLFVALKGDRFDAHDFAIDCATRGARGVIVHQPDLAQELNQCIPGLWIFEVSDTLLALQELAHAYRKTLTAKVLGIAGSNGKTTSKEFTRQLLAPHFKVHASEGSFNNHWGVPLTLLATPRDCEVAVVELGMNHPGELLRLTKIADPDVAVVTCIGVEHIEFFGSLEAISEAESEIYQAASPSSTLLFNMDQQWTQQMRRRFGNVRSMGFSSQDANSEVHLQVAEMSLESLKVRGKFSDKEGTADVPTFGAHNVNNLMVAASFALALGLAPGKIWQSLALCRTSWGRNQLLRTDEGGLVLFDAYNANPDSMEALFTNLQRLRSQYPKQMALLGEMRELGEQAGKWHSQLGISAAKGNFEQVWFVGAHHAEFREGFTSAATPAQMETLVTRSEWQSEIGQKAKACLNSGALIAIKASRGEGLERALPDLIPNFSNKK